MIIYTSITNGYDKLEEPYDCEGVRYVCFYDGEKPDAEGWEYIELDLDIDCPVRRSYHPKHCPHKYFPERSRTVWIDALYPVTKRIVDFSFRQFKISDFTLQRHPEKRSLVHEFSKLYSHGFSTYDECKDMAIKIKSIGYKLSDYDQTINSVIWRKLNPDVIEWCDTWREWYMDGVNRDQVSSSIAEFLTVKADRVDWIVNLDDKRKRLKRYGEAYKLNPLPAIKDRLDLVHSICETFDGWENTLVVKKTYKNIRYLPFDMNDTISKEDMVIYTCITNGYDEIPEENYYDPSVRYVLFHDGTVDVPDPWTGIDIREYTDEKCPRRLSFFPKANPHIFFPEGTHTIWIDGCYVHTKTFVERSLRCFPFTMLRHASRFSYFDEMLEGFTCAFFTYEDALLLTRKLKEKNYNFRTYGSPLGTIVWRTMSEEMNKFNELWYEWSLIGCNRDQISYDAALRFSGLTPSVYENRCDCGINLGYYNKIGRRGKHPQNGDLEQYKKVKELLVDMKKITKLNPKLYTSYPDHGFYMKVYDIIDKY
tara:strand:+ start:375 stop:1982 length:1608 start_codon:yes stop_codon:yes gene_type:complete